MYIRSNQIPKYLFIKNIEIKRLAFRLKKSNYKICIYILNKKVKISRDEFINRISSYIKLQIQYTKKKYSHNI